MSTQSKADVMVVEVYDRRPSNWILDGSEETGLPKRLDTANSKMIKRTSTMKRYFTKKDPEYVEGKKLYTLEKIRYIKGCDTIIVKEQEARGVKPNPSVDSQDLALEHGTKIIVRNGATIALYDYFRNYEGNVDAPNRPDSAVNDFYEIKTAQVAENNIEYLDDKYEAETYLRTLRVKETGKEVIYKTKELDFLCSLFKVPQLDSYGEKFDALLKVAYAKPDVFLETVGNLKSGVIAEVEMGKQLGVVGFDATMVTLTNSNKVLLTFKSQKIDEQVEELAMYFLTTEGEMAYKQFSIELRAAKERAANAVS